MFWHVPSWMKFYNIQEILTISAFVLVFALIEGLIIMGILLLFVILLPGKEFRDNFIPTGCTIITIIGFSAYLLQRNMEIIYDLELWELVLYPILILSAVIILIFLLSWIFHRFESPARIISTIAERMIVFLFIYITLSILGFFLIMLDSIF